MVFGSVAFARFMLECYSWLFIKTYANNIEVLTIVA